MSFILELFHYFDVAGNAGVPYTSYFTTVRAQIRQQRGGTISPSIIKPARHLERADCAVMSDAIDPTP